MIITQYPLDEPFPNLDGLGENSFKSDTDLDQKRVAERAATDTSTSCVKGSNTTNAFYGYTGESGEPHSGMVRQIWGGRFHDYRKLA